MMTGIDGRKLEGLSSEEVTRNQSDWRRGEETKESWKRAIASSLKEEGFFKTSLWPKALGFLDSPPKKALGHKNPSIK